MRGKGRFLPVACLSIGITPAYAGKSSRNRHRNCATTDHPRLCGEKVQNRTTNTGQLGSPPPMRGKAYENKGNSVTFRITPAYAGKSSSHTRRCPSIEDHPRLCGEKIRHIYSTKQQIGSPPPMRGKVLPCTIQRLTGRITPAYAGKRSALHSYATFL